MENTRNQLKKNGKWLWSQQEIPVPPKKHNNLTKDSGPGQEGQVK